MAIVNQNFRNALANMSKSALGTAAGRIYVYKNTIAKPTDIQTTFFTTAPYASALLLTFVITSATFLTNVFVTGAGTRTFSKLAINDIPGSLTRTTMGVFGKETINNIPTSVAS